MSLFSAPTTCILPATRAADELAAAEQAGLFAGERREHDRRRHRMSGEDARRFEQRRRARRVVVGAGPGLDRVVVAADDVDELGVDRAAQRRDDVGGLAVERGARLEPLILGRVAERRVGVEQDTRTPGGCPASRCASSRSRRAPSRSRRSARPTRRRARAARPRRSAGTRGCRRPSAPFRLSRLACSRASTSALVTLWCRSTRYTPRVG